MDVRLVAVPVIGAGIPCAQGGAGAGEELVEFGDEIVPAFEEGDQPPGIIGSAPAPLESTALHIVSREFAAPIEIGQKQRFERFHERSMGVAGLEVLGVRVPKVSVVAGMFQEEGGLLWPAEGLCQKADGAV